MLSNNIISLLFLGAVTLPAALCEKWVQVWSDEFNGNSIDRSKWQFEIGGSGWGNNELEYYTDRSQNAFVSGGNLVIQALREDYGGR